MDSDNATIIVRPAALEDKNFILSTWLKGNYYGNYYFGKMNAGSYYTAYTHYIESILNTQGVSIDIACDESKPHWIVGFVVYQQKIFFLNGYFIHEVSDYYAIGAGTDYALAALYLGASVKEAIDAEIVEFIEEEDV